MYRKYLRFSLTVFFCFLAFSLTHAQDGWWKDKKYKDEFTKQKYALCKKTFKDIGNGLSYRNISNINPYFDEQVYLNIISYEKGYYSSSQAELILMEFMDYFKIINFNYKRSSRYNTYAFAVGKYHYSINGNKRELEVGVSLKYYRDNWYIDQVMIN